MSHVVVITGISHSNELKLTNFPLNPQFSQLISSNAKLKAKLFNNNKLKSKQIMAKKAARDPNMPKRPLSAYFLWMQQNRGQFATQGKSVTDVAKEAGAAWRELSVAQKAPWQQMAVAAKQRYEEEMRQYNDTHGGGHH